MYKVQVASHLKFTDEQKKELEAVSDPLCAEPQITPLPAISVRFL